MNFKLENAAKDLTAALRGDVSGPLGATSLDDLKKMEEISPQKSKSYTKFNEVVTQPPRVKEVAAKPPRVATPIGSPPNNINDDFANRYNINENVPELKLIQSHPNKDDDDDEEEGTK